MGKLLHKVPLKIASVILIASMQSFLLVGGCLRNIFPSPDGPVSSGNKGKPSNNNYKVLKHF
jgi:hypothetical protein